MQVALEKIRGGEEARDEPPPPRPWILFIDDSRRTLGRKQSFRHIGFATGQVRPSQSSAWGGDAVRIGSSLGLRRGKGAEGGGESGRTEGSDAWGRSPALGGEPGLLGSPRCCSDGELCVCVCRDQSTIALRGRTRGADPSPDAWDPDPRVLLFALRLSLTPIASPSPWLAGGRGLWGLHTP